MRTPAVSLRSEILVVAALLSFCPLHLCSQAWVRTAAPVANWRCVASSADGSGLVGGNYLGGYDVYTSTNSGASWSGRGLNALCASAGISADGTKLAVVGGMDEGYGRFMVSTNSGTDWGPPQSTPEGAWSCVAVSANGASLVAGGQTQVSGIPGPLVVSTDWGITPFQSDPRSNYWSSVASSADGTMLVVAAGGRSGATGSIYTSTNSGATWTATRAPQTAWISIASSADGRKLAAAVWEDPSLGWPPGLIYVSTNSGATWVLTGAPTTNWASVACSADGTRLAAAVWSGPIYTSADGGFTWTVTDAPITNWMSVASSADGGRLVGVVYSGGIYASQSPVMPRLSIFASMGGVILSWTIPSTGFVLQEKADLSSTSWGNVTTFPTPDYTSLQYRVTLPGSSKARFYRLVQASGQASPSHM